MPIWNGYDSIQMVSSLIQPKEKAQILWCYIRLLVTQSVIIRTWQSQGDSQLETISRFVLLKFPSLANGFGVMDEMMARSVSLVESAIQCEAAEYWLFRIFYARCKAVQLCRLGETKCTQQKINAFMKCLNARSFKIATKSLTQSSQGWFNRGRLNQRKPQRASA